MVIPSSSIFTKICIRSKQEWLGWSAVKESFIVSGEWFDSEQVNGVDSQVIRRTL
jgi:hypothetical protein